MEGKLEVEWRWLRQHPGQRRADQFIVKSFMNVACTIGISNRGPLIYDPMAKCRIDVLVFLAVMCDGHGWAHDLTHLFSVEFFQSLQLRGLKQGDEHEQVHAATVALNCVSRANACTYRHRLTLCLKHPRKEVLQIGIDELNPVAKLQVVEEVNEWSEGVLADVNGKGIGVTGSFITEENENLNLVKRIGRVRDLERSL